MFVYLGNENKCIQIASTSPLIKRFPSQNGFTPLHLASQEGHTDMVSLLLEHNGDVNFRAKNGLTPMHLAAQEDHVPVAEILVKYDAEIDPQTKVYMAQFMIHIFCYYLRYCPKVYH